METGERSRYEIKLTANDLMLPQVRAWLRVHPAAFRESYPCRQVNNIYFDTPDLISAFENLSGVSTRRKVRLRWYGDNWADIRGVFEVKRKRNMHGWKLSQPLSEKLDLSNMTWAEVISVIRNDLRDDLRMHLASTGLPVLINRYLREYYTSSDGIVRVTLDYRQRIYDQRYGAVPNLAFAVPPSGDLVMEFKSGCEYHRRLADVVSGVPLRLERYSKYVQGVETLLGH